ncbi:Mga helix-turn-helix domain-containing protein [Enterococcus malodoratus]|uniref:helix-turn-helix domain-containing protein n=1 Tax=Enterococcus malodoratus TaxID=71451 RepID=UPI0008ACD53E|nr:helix-turn-helix domain-containing protein [Enterococcus malodoratus]SET71747.1 Mga helix-turn-helix domain-containing protein [Enterococcus malodoratus]
MDFRSILGTSDTRRLALVEKLYYRSDGIASDELLSELECSLPILLNDIEWINERHVYYQIIKVKGLYRLEMNQKVSLGNVYAYILNQSPEFQIIEELLYEKCDSITTLSKKLYLSTSNTQRALKKIEKTLSEAGMTLNYRPLRIEGNESEIRTFYYRFYSERQDAFESTLPNLTPEQYHVIEAYVKEFVEVNTIWKKYVFQKYLVYLIFISLWRIKNNHPFPKEELRTLGIKLPFDASYKELRRVVTEIVGIDLRPVILQDCLWSIFSDSIVFSIPHRELAMTDNPRYQELFMRHFELAKEYDEMTGNHLSKQDRIDLTTVLCNDFYLYNPEGQYIGILWRNRTVFLREVSKVYGRGLQKVRSLVERFVEKYQMYQENDFILNYVYLLITTEINSLEWLSKQDHPLKVLLLSDLTPTEESFLAKQINDYVYGNFSIVLFEQLLVGNAQLLDELKKYDCLITTGSSEGLPEDYPVVVIDPFLTAQSTSLIQDMISQIAEKKDQVTIVE